VGDRPASGRRSSPPEASPPPLTSSLALLLVGAGRAAQRQIDAALAPEDLTLRHVGALGHLAHEPDLSYSDLGRRAGVTPQSMRATVQHLEVLGAVRRTLPGHGHPARLEVTADGQRLLTRAREAVAALDRTLLAAVPTDHLDGMRQALLELVMGGPAPGERTGPSRPPGPPGP
jgi:DNA-binding MarR family transcriptional regulator